MLALLSPSKTLDFTSVQFTAAQRRSHTKPHLLNESQVLIDKLRKMTKPRLSSLMGISAKLADENHRRFQEWHLPFTAKNAKPAVYAFRGDVYEGLNADQFTSPDLKFAQKHLRVLSGLYGLLRPLDLIQPYRLEMGTRLANSRGKDLYAFWGTRITELIEDALAAQKGEKVLVHLASNEYFKSVKTKSLPVRVVTPAFKEDRSGKLQMITFFAKKARGTMASYMIRNRVVDPAQLKDFDEDGYRFSKRHSSEDQWVFVRKSK